MKENRIKNLEKDNKTVNIGRASEFKGVYKHRDAWQSKIKLNGKDVNLGRFSTQVEAAHNYDFHSIKFCGKERYLNFPDFDYTLFSPKKLNPLERKPKKDKNVSKKDGWGRKLNKKIAKEIRKRHANEKLSIKELAKEYEVTFATISRILHNIVYPEKPTSKVWVIYNPK